jgi:nitrate reductase molybdenum cofactor assembly chaperone NarJ/NarW
MAGFKKSPTPNRHTLRVLARLLSYPDAALREQLPALREALAAEAALGPARRAELDAFTRGLLTSPAMDSEALYVELFDRGRGCALHLFEHVHGDSRERGPAMVALVKTYEEAGLLMKPGELPDHLAVALEYASTQSPARAREFLREIGHILQIIFSALLKRRSAYASVIGAVLDLAGVAAQAVPLPAEESLDESWAEPPVFSGCSNQGQARPGQPQPIHIVKAMPSPGARA